MWAFERAGWVAISLLLLGAILGLFGSAGLLAGASVESPDGGLRLTYARFARHSAPTSLAIELGPETTAVDRVRIAVSRTYLEGMEFETILPEPETIEVNEDELIYLFLIAQPGAPATVTFGWSPRRYARQHGWVALPGGPRVPFTQLVHP